MDCCWLELVLVFWQENGSDESEDEGEEEEEDEGEDEWVGVKFSSLVVRCFKI